MQILKNLKNLKIMQEGMQEVTWVITFQCRMESTHSQLGRLLRHIQLSLTGCSSQDHSCGLGGLDGQSIAMANVLEIKSDHVALGH